MKKGESKTDKIENEYKKEVKKGKRKKQKKRKENDKKKKQKRRKTNLDNKRLILHNLHV